MNKFFYVLLIALVISSCATSKQSVTSGIQDGMSFQSAVVATSISSEYEWVRKNYPGSQTLSQALVKEKGKYYDVLTIRLADGSTKEFYFDINSFYGKGF